MILKSHHVLHFSLQTLIFLLVATTELLDLGPKFVPTKKFSKQTELNINVQLAKLAYQLRWREIFKDSSESDNHPARPSYGEPQTILEAI